MEFRLTKRLAEYDIADLHAKHSEIRIEAEIEYTKMISKLFKTSLVISAILIIIMYLIDHDYKQITAVGSIFGTLVITYVYSTFRKNYVAKKTFYIAQMVESKRKIDLTNHKRELKTKCITDGANVHPFVYAKTMNAPEVAKAYKDMNHSKSKLEGMQEGFEIWKEVLGEPLRKTSRKSKKGKKK